MTRSPRSKSRARKQLETIHGGSLSLGALLASIRKGEGWLAEMAKRLKVTRAHVAAIEHGKPLAPQTAAKYAKVLGYSQEQFVRLSLQDAVHRARLPYKVDVSLPAE